MTKKINHQISFRKQDSVGVNDAADDREYLLNCFVDLGDLETIKSFNDPRCLIVGRTGAGKTALITKLQSDLSSRVIVVDAESLAMNYISNSSIVNSLSSLNIDLNTFFKYLWRHVICVEILTKHIKIASEKDSSDFYEKVRYEFRKKNIKHLKALDYLDEWKNSFWKTSDSHVTEVTNKVESEVQGQLGVDAKKLNAKVSGKSAFSAEEKIEYKQIGQSIVNDMQMKEVSGLLEMLDDFIELHQLSYYVVIDKLDEKWVSNDIRYRLIKSLIETLKDLNKLHNIKPVATLRYDLISRVFDITKDSGFQEEKYNSLYVNIRWRSSELIDLINKRINHLLEDRYSKRTELSIGDIFPEKVGDEEITDYLVSRTLMKPRDIIEFVNICINLAGQGDGLVTEGVVEDAEVIYSKGRLDALSYEWGADYPALRSWSKILQKRPDVFRLDQIELKSIEDRAIEYAANPDATDINSTDTILGLSEDLVNNKISCDDFRKKIVFIFYRVGLIGVREPEYKKVNWSHLQTGSIKWDDLEDDAELHIHPCFRTALKIKRHGIGSFTNQETIGVRKGVS